MFKIFLISIVLIFSLTACQATPPKPVSKEIKWEADTDIVADAKNEAPQETPVKNEISEEASTKNENSEETSPDKNIKDTPPTPTVSPQKAPTATPKVEKSSIRYAGMTVYVTKSGKKFHREDCSSLSKSKIPMLFEDACAKNYTPCEKCKP
jgi:hypothetical protein